MGWVLVSKQFIAQTILGPKVKGSKFIRYYGPLYQSHSNYTRLLLLQKTTVGIQTFSRSGSTFEFKGISKRTEEMTFHRANHAQLSFFSFGFLFSQNILKAPQDFTIGMQGQKSDLVVRPREGRLTSCFARKRREKKINSSNRNKRGR